LFKKNRDVSEKTPAGRQFCALENWYRVNLLASWTSLTDRTYSARHLLPASSEYLASLPSEADVVDLFRRDEEIKSTATERNRLDPSTDHNDHLNASRFAR
jgi:hypothetical protein